ncbi:serine/threonine protein kinase [Melittangium boletus]|uniref:Protein kinase n=1 Tax=Melittangium boletus DSM 14713 TaxID=1294270 RepID=A0A250IBR2_9BACT|nr:serine/threonine-protein kinase [Melittangium boletus]ATB28396.1 protein kinase [Melittangium boletus DSM 14713]
MPRLEEPVRPGSVVGGYRVDKPLGAGGYGQVFLASRDGGPCALKFLHLERVGEWGWRELLILMSHEFPYVVTLRGHFKWPEEAPEFLVLVMEYVPGVTLFQWAQDTNPSARELVEKLLPLSWALEAVHAAGVLHRDLKGDNVLVRDPDGAPVLVDFGAGFLPHAPPATREVLAPANLRYRSPESVSFLLRRLGEPGARYEYAVSDEMYALGVLLYVLATGVYPFEGPEDELMAEIVAGRLRSPRERNSRVPPALCELCLHLLAREPQARVPDAGTLSEALEKLLEDARGDSAWDMPLCYGWTADGLSTEHLPELADKNTPEWMRRWVHRKPRRGKPPPPPPAESPSLPEPSTVKSEPPTRSRKGWLAFVLMTGLGLAGVGVGLGQLAPSPSRAPAPVGWEWMPFPPDESSLLGPMPWAVHDHEVAPPWKPLEADPGAAPPRADTPASVTIVMLRTENPRMKKKKIGSMGTNALLAVTAAANVACPGVQVRKDPPPEACPVGAVETMTVKLGLPLGRMSRNAGFAHFPDWEKRKPVPVRDGPIVLDLAGNWRVWGGFPARDPGPIALPDKTRLLGRLFIGEKYVYGRITQAIIPSGDTLNVCLIIREDGIARGVPIRSDSEEAKVFPIVELETVDRFE